MHRLIIGKLKYTYLAGHHAVAIITHRGQKHQFPIEKVQSDPRFRVQNGTSDGRIAPQEVAAFILKRRIR